MTEALPDRNVLVSAIILLFAGASSVAAIILGMLEDALLLDASVLALPIGYGVLVGNENSRWLARLGSAVVLVGVCVGLAVLSVYAIRGHQLEDITWSSGFSVAMWTVLSLIVFLGLRKHRVGDWFSETRSRGFARSCALGIALLAGANTAEGYLRVRALHSQMDRAFPVCVRIKPVDAETGAGIPSIALPPRMQSSGRRHPYYAAGNIFPKLDYGTMATADGMEVVAEGILLEPTQITIGADGYREASVTLSRKTKAGVRLLMVKEKDESGEDEHR